MQPTLEYFTIIIVFINGNMQAFKINPKISEQCTHIITSDNII